MHLMVHKATPKKMNIMLKMKAISPLTFSGQR